MRRSTRSGGFTLLEVSAALSVLGVLAVLLHGGHDESDRHLGDSLRRSAALRAASARIEELRSGLADWSAGEERVELAPHLLRVLPEGEMQQWIRERETGLFDVSVRVRWASARGFDDEVVLRSVLRAEGEDG